MGAQRGKDLLLKVDPAGGTAFRTVAGLRSRRIAFNAETVDVTDSESAGRWRELLGGAGVQRAALSGAGIFKDAESDAAVRQLFFAGQVGAFQAVIPDFGIVSGPFQVTPRHAPRRRLRLSRSRARNLARTLRRRAGAPAALHARLGRGGARHAD